MSETEFARAERLSLELFFLKKELDALREVAEAARNVVGLAICDDDAMSILNFEFEGLEAALKNLDEARQK